jgi:hypothetical protein
MIGAMRTLASAFAPLIVLAASAGTTAAQQLPSAPNANACLVWITNTLLASPYFQVAKNDCAYAIRVEYRYEADVGVGCFGPSSCGGILTPNEIRRFTTGTIRYWACRMPAMPKFPDITRDGICE